MSTKIRLSDVAGIRGPRERPDEANFRDWYDFVSRTYDLAPNPDTPDQFYDYRAAFRAGAMPDEETQHWPSAFKRPGHPNEIVGGFNTVTGEPEPGYKQETSVYRLVEMGWDPETANALVQKVKPYHP